MRGFLFLGYMKNHYDHKRLKPESSQKGPSRMLSFKLPKTLEEDWSNAVRLSGFTQTDILVEFIKAYIRNQHHINKEINEAIDTLMEQKEINEKKIIASSLDEAIRSLKNKKIS